mgnify:CR=1 FL=1
MRQFLLRWTPPLVWAAVIFFFSSLPTLPKVEVIWGDFILKKPAHVIEYAILFFLTLRAFRYKHWPVVLIICILYALSDEFHQSFVMGRTSKLTDVGFDTVGMLLSSLYVKRSQKNS